MDEKGLVWGFGPLVLGLNKYSHDASVCVVDSDSDAVLYAGAKERLSRRKHDGGGVGEAVDVALSSIGAKIEDVALVVQNNHHHRIAPFERRLPWAVKQGYESADGLHPLNLLEHGHLEKLELSHHLAHAWSAAALCPFDHGLVLVMDGMGDSQRNFKTRDERVDFMTDDALPKADAFKQVPDTFAPFRDYREAETVYRFDDRGPGPMRLELLFKRWTEEKSPSELYNYGFENMESIGAIYSRVSSQTFGDWNACGKVMGLGPWAPTWRKHSSRDERSARSFMSGSLLEGLFKVHWDELNKLEYSNDFKAALREGDDLRKLFYAEVAEAVQDDLEGVCMAAVRDLKNTHGPGEANLCFAGGVALNSVLNGRIQKESQFQRVYIPPFPGDDGVSVGCALYGASVLRGESRPSGRERTVFEPFQGPKYTADDILEAISEYAPWVEVVASYDVEDQEYIEFVADAIANGKVVGWFQGRGEVGPRALGARSILADPRDPEMADFLNVKVKKREVFRPFAPSCLGGEHAAAWFELDEGDSGYPGLQSPYMSITARVLDEKRSLVPSITHIDGTARLQTVPTDAQTGEWSTYRRLLEAFLRITGVPMVLNTSFNLAGEPIVETPFDAVRSFLSMSGYMDFLALQGVVLRVRSFDQVVEENGAVETLAPIRATEFVSELLTTSVGDTLTARVKPVEADKWIELEDEISLALLEVADGDVSIATMGEELELSVEEVAERARALYEDRLVHFGRRAQSG
uniref:Carbamoyltransferase n=1 Tax=Pinguiococcus pyrenoidosus TaxID=172671 RepID=A0A7R9U4N9_9STRA